MRANIYFFIPKICQQNPAQGPETVLQVHTSIFDNYYCCFRNVIEINYCRSLNNLSEISHILRSVQNCFTSADDVLFCISPHCGVFEVFLICDRKEFLKSNFYRHADGKGHFSAVRYITGLQIVTYYVISYYM